MATENEPKTEQYIGAAEARRAIGVDSATFQAWLNRDLLPFETVQQGARTWRRFKMSDLITLTVVASLWRLELPISTAVEMAKLIQAEMLKPENKLKNDAPRWVIFGDRKVYFVRQGEGIRSLLQYDLKNPACILIDLEDLSAEIKRNMHAARKMVAAKGGAE